PCPVALVPYTPLFRSEVGGRLGVEGRGIDLGEQLGPTAGGIGQGRSAVGDRHVPEACDSAVLCHRVSPVGSSSTDELRRSGFLRDRKSTRLNSSPVSR